MWQIPNEAMAYFDVEVGGNPDLGWIQLAGFWQDGEYMSFSLHDLLSEAGIEVGLVRPAKATGRTRDKLLRDARST